MCTHANQGTGYARSAAKMVNYLVDKPNTDVVYYAFQNYKGQEINDRFIDPRIRFVDALELDPDAPKGFGDAGIVPTFKKENPDILFIYNDISVCEAILKMLGNVSCKIVLFLDLVYPWEDVNRFEYLRSKVDLCYVLAQSWKDHMVNDLGWDSDKIVPFHLGVDFDKFKNIETTLAKKELELSPDDFVVLNLNRNSYRKQWCTTIKAWFKFWVDNDMNPRIKLFIGCLLSTDDGYDIRELIKVECMKYKIDVNIVSNNNIFINPRPLTSTDEYVNLLYAGCDVGINTCCGEGYGLISVEHALHGKPQVVAGVPAVKEVIGPVSYVVEPNIWVTMSKFESHGGEIALFDFNIFSNILTNLFLKKEDNILIKKRIEFIKENCNWEKNLKVLDSIY
jgi:hypothetical protein